MGNYFCPRFTRKAQLRHIHPHIKNRSNLMSFATALKMGLIKKKSKNDF
jgi:hypothetical protein